eukprot:jgi/Mesvir1/6098/Mv00813-RA.2
MGSRKTGAPKDIVSPGGVSVRSLGDASPETLFSSPEAAGRGPSEPAAEPAPEPEPVPAPTSVLSPPSKATPAPVSSSDASAAGNSETRSSGAKAEADAAVKVADLQTSPARKPSKEDVEMTNASPAAAPAPVTSKRKNEEAPAAAQGAPERQPTSQPGAPAAEVSVPTSAPGGDAAAPKRQRTDVASRPAEAGDGGAHKPAATAPAVVAQGATGAEKQECSAEKREVAAEGKEDKVGKGGPPKVAASLGNGADQGKGTGTPAKAPRAHPGDVPKKSDERKEQDSGAPKPVGGPSAAAAAAHASDAAPSAPSDAASGPSGSKAVRVDNLVRPFQVPKLRELLAQTGSVEGFWINNIKSFCYVTYASSAQADATRLALSGQRWPKDSNKLLAVTSVSEEEARAISAGEPWPPVTAAAATAAPAAGQKSTMPGGGGQNKGAPAQGGGKQPPLSQKQGAAPAAAQDREPELTLEQVFRKTEAVPSIYFLPLTAEQVEAKRRQAAAASAAPRAQRV